MTDDLSGEISVSELIGQLRASYAYLASLYPRWSVEREVYQGLCQDLWIEMSIAGVAVVLQKRIHKARQRIADEQWRPEYRQQWREKTACQEQILEAMNRLGATVALLEHVRQQIKERLQ